MLRHYILDANGDPVEVDDFLTWGRWFETAHRVIASDKDESVGADGVHVSTVFLGLDHNFDAVGPPVLWETMVFGGPLHGEQDRYASRAAALEGHQAMCARVKAATR